MAMGPPCVQASVICFSQFILSYHHLLHGRMHNLKHVSLVLQEVIHGLDISQGIPILGLPLHVQMSLLSTFSSFHGGQF